MNLFRLFRSDKRSDKEVAYLAELDACQYREWIRGMRERDLKSLREAQVRGRRVSNLEMG